MANPEYPGRRIDALTARAKRAESALEEIRDYATAVEPSVAAAAPSDRLYPDEYAGRLRVIAAMAREALSKPDESERPDG